MAYKWEGPFWEQKGNDKRRDYAQQEVMGGDGD